MADHPVVSLSTPVTLHPKAPTVSRAYLLIYSIFWPNIRSRQVTEHVGAVLGVNVTGPYFLDYNGYIVVPWQYEMDLSFLYKTKNDRFEAKLALLNLTDQKNWSPPNPFYGNDSVVAEWPFHVEATITFKF